VTGRMSAPPPVTVCRSRAGLDIGKLRSHAAIHVMLGPSYSVHRLRLQSLQIQDRGSRATQICVELSQRASHEEGVGGAPHLCIDGVGGSSSQRAIFKPCVTLRLRGGPTYVAFFGGLGLSSTESQ
jgi:hypothetical protein